MIRYPRPFRFPRFRKKKNRLHVPQCICGSQVNYYSGLHERGFCSTDCEHVYQKVKSYGT